MPRFEPLPESYDDARPVLDRMLRGQAIQGQRIGGSRRRVQPPRSILAQKGSLKATVTWSAPEDDRGIVGYKVYLGNDTTLYATIRDRATRKIEIPLSANTSKGCAVSAFGAMEDESESIRVPFIIQSNTDQLVVTGTTGATAGTTPPDPPEWPSEPTGGCVKKGTHVEPLSGEIFIVEESWGEWYGIRLANGRTLDCVPKHPLYTDRGKTEAQNVLVGEEIITKHGMVRVEYIRHYFEDGIKLNIRVPDGGMYYANDCLSHNSKER